MVIGGGQDSTEMMRCIKTQTCKWLRILRCAFTYCFLNGLLDKNFTVCDVLIPSTFMEADVLFLASGGTIVVLISKFPSICYFERKSCSLLLLNKQAQFFFSFLSFSFFFFSGLI